MSRLILASQSAARAEMLRRAGLTFETEPAKIDEAALIASFKSEQAEARGIADALAELKAQRVSNRHPDAIVIGADQLLICEGEIFSKPGTRAKARRQLEALSGRTHQLISAVCLACSGHAIWRHVDRAELALRTLSGEAIDLYLAEAGDAVLQCVGAYQLEGLGVRLFAKVEGDYFTILGMPLIPLLQGLRELGAIA